MRPHTVRKNVSTAAQSMSSHPEVKNAHKVDQGISSKVSVAGFTASSKDSQNTLVALKHAPGRPRPMDGPSARAAALRNVLLPLPPPDVR